MGVVVGGVEHPVEQAAAVCVGYAFAEERLNWVADPMVAGTALGDGPGSRRVGRWAFGTYDAVAADPSRGLRGVDLFIADGLNGRMHARTLASIMAVADDVSQALGHLDDGLVFWEMPYDHLRQPPLEGVPAWHMWRAWSLLMGAPSVGVAVAHKTLHHKRPNLFPLIDNLTLPELFAVDGAWATIHSELTSRDQEWADVEESFGAFATRQRATPLLRLRLHDILLWTRCSGSLADAAERGEQLITAGR